MKTIILTFLFALISITTISAKVTIPGSGLIIIPPIIIHFGDSVHISPGGLSKALGGYMSSDYWLTITGTMDARDFKTMRDSMPNLNTINISSASIVAYTGALGTVAGSTAYLANTIPQSAMFGNTVLDSILLPTSITTIDSMAFNNCTALTSINVPQPVTKIGGRAFDRCSSLSSVTFSSAFQKSGKFLKLIPPALTYVGNSAFYNCTGLKTIQIPSKVNYIGTTAFYHCSAITSLSLPSGITKILSYTFENCTGLTSMNLPTSLTSIGNYAFYGCASLNTQIPSTVSSIGNYAFYNCAGLNTLTIPAGMTNISPYSFYGCTGLNTVYIPSNITTIDTFAFYACTNLHYLTLSSSVSAIRYRAFGSNSTSNYISIIALNPTPLSGTNMGTQVFYNAPTSTCTLGVPTTSVSAYSAASQWKDFAPNIKAVSLTFSKTNISVNQAANSKSFVALTASIAWTATHKQSWLQLSKTSGSVSSGDTIFITATTANTGSLPRIDTITFAASGVSPSPIVIVTQKATPVMGWSTPADIVYGISLSDPQLNASASTTGSFNYNPSPGTVLKPGSHQTLNTTFTPSDTSLFTMQTDSVYINVTKKSLTINASPITKVYDGTTTATIPNIALIGVVAGDTVSLTNTGGTYTSANVANSTGINTSMKLTGKDTSYYTLTPRVFSGNITQAPLTVIPDNKNKDYFDVNPKLTCSYSGFVNSETESVFTSKPILSTVATKASAPGTYDITASYGVINNYALIYQTGTFTINNSAIQLCIVTVNPTSGYNMMAWQPKKKYQIRMYNIYKQGNQAGVYDKLGSVLIASKGIFVDSTTRNAKHAEYYKITAVDSSNNESSIDQCNYHETTFLQYVSNTSGVNLSWSAYKIENAVMNFKSYVIYKGNDSTKLIAIDTVAANIYQYTDTGYKSRQYRTFYRIGGILNNACNTLGSLKAGEGLLVESVSNMEDNRLRSTGTGIQDVTFSASGLSVYPNPFNSLANIEYKLQTSARVEINIYDILGCRIATLISATQLPGTYQKVIDPASMNMKQGIYIIEMKNDERMFMKKIVFTK